MIFHIPMDLCNPVWIYRRKINDVIWYMIWYMTHSIHKEGDILQIYFCVIFHETRHHAQAHITSGALCLFFGSKNTEGRAVGWFPGHCLLWLLLLRLAVVVVPLLPQNHLLTLLAFAPDSKVMSATRILLMASSSSFIYFFWPLLKTHNGLPCLDYHVWWHSLRNVVPVTYECVFYSDSKTVRRLWCDCCIKIPAIWGCPRRCYKIDCMLHITTPQPQHITPALQEACLWDLL